MIIDTDNLLTITDFAKHSGVGYKSIQRAVKDGRIQSIKICGHEFIDTSTEHYKRVERKPKVRFMPPKTEVDIVIDVVLTAYQDEVFKLRGKMFAKDVLMERLRGHRRKAMMTKYRHIIMARLYDIGMADIDSAMMFGRTRNAAIHAQKQVENLYKKQYDEIFGE